MIWTPFIPGIGMGQQKIEILNLLFDNYSPQGEPHSKKQIAIERKM